MHFKRAYLVVSNSASMALTKHTRFSIGVETRLRACTYGIAVKDEFQLVKTSIKELGHKWTTQSRLHCPAGARHHHRFLRSLRKNFGLNFELNILTVVRLDCLASKMTNMAQIRLRTLVCRKKNSIIKSMKKCKKSVSNTSERREV